MRFAEKLAMRPSLRPLLPKLLVLSLPLVGCDCEPESALLVTAVRDLGPMVQNDPIAGRDGGYSAKFGDRAVWVFGDSIMTRAGVDGSSWRNNTWSWSFDDTPEDGLGPFEESRDAAGVPLELFPQTPEEAAFNQAHAGDDCEVAPCGAREALWPGPVVADPERGRAIVFYTKIHGEPGEWNFYGMGCGVALWDDPETRPFRPEARPGGADPTLLWTKQQAFCPSAALLVDGYVLAYGCSGDIDKPCKLARAPAAEVEKASAWTYYDGTDYRSELGEAETLFSGNDMMSLHRSSEFGVFVAIYSEPLDSAVVLRTADDPRGPWSAAEYLFDGKRSPEGQAPYSGLGHAELASGVTEYVSYYRTTAPFRGELRLVAVDLARR